MSSTGHHPKIIALKALLVLLLIGAIFVALWASQADPQNWSIADWGAFVISIILSLYFLTLSQLINSKAQERAKAVADAELITSTGLLAMNSARSLSGLESSALRVAADARAALQHYPSATRTKKLKYKNAKSEEEGIRSVKEVLVESVVDAYIDLAFSAFLHSGGLARSVWSRLCKGSADVVAEANKLAYTASGRRVDSTLASVADHVAFVELIGRALRKDAERNLEFPGTRRLPSVWDYDNLPYSPAHREHRSEKDETAYRLDRFAELYKYELTVAHDWKMMHKNATKISCEVELVNISATSDWLAPWYVKRGADGELIPVNVLGGDLDEQARYDDLEDDNSIPQWPSALSHGRLPNGMRTKGIKSLCRVLETQPSPTICVFAYELRLDRKSDRTKRVVLDGNHRLAAARRLSLAQATGPGQSPPSRQFKVLTFLIRELQPIDDLTTLHEKQGFKEPWKGFTPDIGLIRGTWRPK